MPSIPSNVSPRHSARARAIDPGSPREQQLVGLVGVQPVVVQPDAVADSFDRLDEPRQSAPNLGDNLVDLLARRARRFAVPEGRDERVERDGVAAGQQKPGQQRTHSRAADGDLAARRRWTVSGPRMRSSTPATVARKSDHPGTDLVQNTPLQRSLWDSDALRRISYSASTEIHLAPLPRSPR